jgi:hypothetical protein
MSEPRFDLDEVVVCGVVALCLENAALGIIYRLMAQGAASCAGSKYGCSSLQDRLDQSEAFCLLSFQVPIGGSFF